MLSENLLSRQHLDGQVYVLVSMCVCVRTGVISQ